MKGLVLESVGILKEGAEDDDVEEESYCKPNEGSEGVVSRPHSNPLVSLIARAVEPMNAMRPFRITMHSRHNRSTVCMLWLANITVAPSLDRLSIL